MVDFTLTDEQKACARWRTTSPRRRSARSPGSTTRTAPGPRRSSTRPGRSGLMNTHVPEEYGGPGPVATSTAASSRRSSSWGCSGIQTSLGANGLAAAPVALGGSEEVKKEYFGDADRGAEARLVLPDRARRRLRRLGHAHPRRQARATSTSSTARSASSPTAATPTGTRSTPRPTRTPATAASPPSWSARTTRSSWTRRRTRWASGRRTPRPSRSTTPRSTPSTCSARRTRASSSR